MTDLGKLISLFHCENAEAWGEVLFSLGREMGFDQVLYGAVPTKHAKLETAFVHSNYAPEWRSHYDAEKLAYIDPTVSHSLGSSMAIIWQPDTFQSAEQHAMYEEASSFGIRSGVTLPVHGPGGEFGVISFACDTLSGNPFARRLQQMMPSLSLIRDYVFASSQRFMAQHDVPEVPPRLTKRELEVLQWVMVGKSSWEISRITRCSEATVNFHIANVRQKFNVNTRQQALVKAIRMGIITPEDPHR